LEQQRDLIYLTMLIRKTKMMRISIIILPIMLFISLMFHGCRQDASESALYETDTLTSEDETIRKAKSIFYYMYLPSEMYKLFEKSGAIYDPTILNPVENVNRYTLTSKAAVNLGIYGVDLSYNKIFGQNQKTLLYFTVIHKLSQQLGIPDNQFASALKGIEKNITNKDSLTFYATNMYSATNRYLNENDRQATAALIIMGGWVEALYIACTISDENPDNKEILERIAFQKYSLKSLISLLNNYQGDAEVSKYLVLLKSLKRTFNNIELYYERGDIELDTINKYINANKVDLNFTNRDIVEIKRIVASMRNDIVN
jgi:hypothetical protein